MTTIPHGDITITHPDGDQRFTAVYVVSLYVTVNECFTATV